MIRKQNLEAMIKSIGYIHGTRSKVFEKKYAQFDCMIEVDFNGRGSINYPEDKGYRPEHIELEKEWTLGHSDKSGFADILVKDADVNKSHNSNSLIINECCWLIS